MGKESGIPGVFWEKDRGAWRVSIDRDGGKIYLGRRKTLEEATKLRRDAEEGQFPTDDERTARTPEQIARVFDKMARLRMRAVWREATKGDDHGWKSFDDFMMSVGDRPKAERKLVAKDEALPIGPDNFQWVKPKYDHLSKDGRSEYQKAHRAENPMLYRDEFRKRFGITLVDYQAKFVEQKGVCAICGKPETGTRNGVTRWLCVDHNHETNAVRGLLCTNCNVAVGMMQESRQVMRAAIEYLDRWDGVEATMLNVISIDTALGFGT